MEASWDLRAPSSPKSLCVFVAASPSGRTSNAGINPFDAAADSSSTSTTSGSGTVGGAHGVLFGTERGSLHYRAYGAPQPKATSTAMTTSRSGQQLQAPLGAVHGQKSGSKIPRSQMPIDLANIAPGMIVDIIPLNSHMSSSNNNAIFLLLVDDNRGATASSGAYLGMFVQMTSGSGGGSGGMTISPLSTSSPLPRMSCAGYRPSCGLVFAAGRAVTTLDASLLPKEVSDRNSKTTYEFPKRDNSTLPSAGCRSGPNGLALTNRGRVAVMAIGNAFYAISASIVEEEEEQDDGSTSMAAASRNKVMKLISFSQSSQVHPVIVLDLQDDSLDPGWSSVFCASGRECAVLDFILPEEESSLSGRASVRNESVTVASPILAAAVAWPYLALLTSDGILSIRSPSCMAIALRTMEVGTRPNDFFVLQSFEQYNDHNNKPCWLASISYSGEGRVLQCPPDTGQDLADRLMRLAIDAFGANGFPRSELAEAVNASFTATSYVGPEPTGHAKSLLRQYLQAVLGLSDFDSGAASGWPTEWSSLTNKATTTVVGHFGAFDEAGSVSAEKKDAGVSSSIMSMDASPMALVCGTALLCLVCSQVSPPLASLASRAAKTCCAKVGVVFAGTNEMPNPAVQVCEYVAESLLGEASKSFSLLNVSTPTPITSSYSKRPAGAIQMDFVEAAIWLLRSCGKHERAIQVLYERIQQNKTSSAGSSSSPSSRQLGWSQIKFDSYTATHLSDLWASGQGEGCRLVIRSDTTRRLLESNPQLGLNVFTAMHPQNESQWKTMLARDDPLAHATYPNQVVELLKTIKPTVPPDDKYAVLDTGDEGDDYKNEGTTPLPLNTGRDLAVAYLESAIGITSSRPTNEDVFDHLPPDANFEERAASLHDELAYLLLEGVISERGDNDQGADDSPLGKLYRGKLRRLLKWPLAKVHSEKLLSSLPHAFRQEHALLLGRLGRHEDALRILYCDLHSLDLALAYCDARYERQQLNLEQERMRRGGQGLSSKKKKDCSYLPLVRVALESDPDSERGTKAAIQVLALRSGAIDRASALRLLPKNVPVSAVARPFLIPALVDSESEIRRLKVVSALLRAKYVSLKQRLTDAQIKSQSTLQGVAQLRALNLGDVLHSTKPFKARPAHSASSTFPEVLIIKHFFPRHLVIQAKVTNSAPSVEDRTLGDVAFVVAESSEEAIQPSLQVPLKALPFRSTGSVWCVLTAAPQRIEGMALLTCELRYTVLAVDATTGAPLSFGGDSGRTYVEELQDIEVHAAHFS